MTIRDLVGNPLEVGDLVVLKTELVVGQIVKIESGEIARGVSISGQPQGELPPPMVVVSVQMSTAAVPLPNGQCMGLVKATKPEKEKSVLDNG